MALPSATDVEYVGSGSSGGTVLGHSSTELIGFYGVTTPIAQRSGSSQSALTLTTATGGGYGFITATAFNAFTAQLEELRASMVALGLLAGS